MKIKKILSIIAIVFMFFLFTGCRKNTINDGVYEGEYIESTQWATYTANVKVTVMNGKISEVILKDNSNIHSSIDEWKGHISWTNHVNEILTSYVGIGVEEIIKSDTAPIDALSGATLSSNRLFLAIKDALKD